MVFVVGAAFAVLYATVFLLVYRQTKRTQGRGGSAGLYVMGGIVAFTAILGVVALVV